MASILTLAQGVVGGLIIRGGGTSLKVGSKTPLQGSDFDRVTKVAKVALAAADTGGGVFAWQNPESVSILINRVILDVTTIATGAGTVSVGTTATNATTSSANLIDTLDVHSAIGVFDNLADGGTGGKMKQKLASGKWVTASKASGAMAGLVGSAYIHYTLV